jgi:GNAT superfamily N-acetyltransferase
MPIRPATLADVPAMIRCGCEFLEAARQTYGVTPDPAELGRILAAFVAHPAICALVVEERGDILGGIVGALAAPWFAPQARFAREECLFIREPSRGGPAAVRLIHAFERWAKAHGARHVVLSSITAVKGEAVGTLFARLGYVESERAYGKEI